MITRLILFFAIIAGLASTSAAEHAAPELKPETAKHLVSRISDIRASYVKVGSITYGSSQTADGFHHRDACRVTAIVDVRQNGVVVRQVRHYTFLWNCTYGWFYQRIAKESGGEALDIWSERSGEFTVK